MEENNAFEVLIIGGSYAGLSAALTLGRSRRKTIIIDSGEPCNSASPKAHNLLTHDGSSPAEITAIGKAQVLMYPSIEFKTGKATQINRALQKFEVVLESGEKYLAKKIVLATGIRDQFPAIDGFAECWGKTVIHCPYCHGFELKDRPTAIFANGEIALNFAKLVYNLTKDITILTNGKKMFSASTLNKFKERNIRLIEARVARIIEKNGAIEALLFEDGSSIKVAAMYAGLSIKQHSDIPEKIGCEMDDQGLIKVDSAQQTSIKGIFACGDNSAMRSLSVAIKTGMIAGGFINSELCEENF